ncbi:hypothetical protein ACO0K9_01950 [Undibacterium sp. Ji50W]|uniref:hypothetical protein n=1 Tax=Undibacterium sp. Ji50W TaxID=3413041 RepID=UPI003BF4138C
MPYRHLSFLPELNNQGLPGQLLYQQSDLGTEPQMPRLFFSERLAELQDWIKQLCRMREIDHVSGNHVAPSISLSSCLKYQAMFERIDVYLATVVLLPMEFEYSEYLNVFIESCLQLLILTKKNGSVVKEVPHSSSTQLRYVVPDWDGFCRLLEVMYAKSRTAEFKAKLRLQAKEANERYTDYCNYVNALFDCCDRLVVLRVDLAYCKELTCKMSLEMALADLDRLFANMRNNYLFESLEGYIVKTEYGIERGIHFHLVLFFNGSARNGSSHIFHAMQIGQYWSEVVTRGRGGYWNCNKEAKNYHKMGRLGVGLIRWNEMDLRNNLLEHVVGYICKQDQCFRSLLLPKAKLIRRGQYPDVPEVRLGRRRLLG